MNIKIRCSDCGDKLVINILEVKEFVNCKKCGGKYVLNEDVNNAIRKAVSVNTDIHLREAINTLGLEKVIELVNKYSHLKEIYKYKINSMFKGVEVIK